MNWGPVHEVNTCRSCDGVNMKMDYMDKKPSWGEGQLENIQVIHELSVHFFVLLRLAVFVVGQWACGHLSLCLSARAVGT